MKNRTMSVLLLGVLGAGFAAGSAYKSHTAVSAAAEPSRVVRYYVDPMHPSYKSDQPGVAPDCGMALEAVYADEVSAAAALPARVPGAVYVNPRQQAMIGVRVAAVAPAAATGRLRLYGRVVADEARVYRVNVGVDGFVREAPPVAAGSLVEKDAWLATVSAPDARASIQAFIVALDVVDRARKAGEAQSAVDFANAALVQGVDRLLTLGISVAQIETIRQTRQVPATLRIAAPEAGFVIARNVSPGQRLQRGDELFRIADLRHVWILADVPGRDVEYVGAGAAAEVSLPGRGGTLRGRVSTSVPAQFDIDSQSAAVRIDMDNAGLVLRPGMFVDVDVPVSLPRALTVPATAIVDSGLKKSVFVERAAGVFEPRQIETGWRLSGSVEVLKGLQPGERVAVEGTFLLDAESRIRGVTSPDGPRP